ncbi:hypothetical protein PtA15_15A211 [Puccinia triticina]|uniref:Uncharacterized protein n=1 Tax=Puccinia triticina TaxID=208348 RepID=A0ABY7D2I3_9BASI|nr:uncharacterized protein PtA15_15A211 [Puccinia triticina]WAQ91819.1 hypothetical protein PtA15_15A211 [Puccinia triticina]WAR62614.1 hypothetical protein PtB15_15B200 [Puccinia triticina]
MESRVDQPNRNDVEHGTSPPVKAGHQHPSFAAARREDRPGWPAGASLQKRQSTEAHRRDLGPMPKKIFAALRQARRTNYIPAEDNVQAVGKGRACPTSSAARTPQHATPARTSPSATRC